MVAADDASPKRAVFTLTLGIADLQAIGLRPYFREEASLWLRTPRYVTAAWRASTPIA